MRVPPALRSCELHGVVPVTASLKVAVTATPDRRRRSRRRPGSGLVTGRLGRCPALTVVKVQVTGSIVLPAVSVAPLSGGGVGRRGGERGWSGSSVAVRVVAS